MIFMLSTCAPTTLAVDSYIKRLEPSTGTAEVVTVEQCQQGGGEVDMNPGGYPRHCKGGIHDGTPLAY